MSLSIEVQKKQLGTENRKVSKPSEVFELEEVKEIKDAIQEHLLFIGLDRRNNIRGISLLGIGSSIEIDIDCKYVLRTALITASDKVILVHNHPSNEIEPSNEDKKFTNTISKLLKAFDIELVDHVIVSENQYTSMGTLKLIDKDYESYRTNLLDNALLLEENNKLKNEIAILTDKLQKIQNFSKQEEEEFE